MRHQTYAMLCDQCQEREAAVFITAIVGGVSERRNLCSACHEVDMPGTARELADAFQAGCRYCGETPQGGGADLLAALNGVQKISLMCASCSQEYYRFLRTKWPDIGAGSFSAEEFQTYDFPAILTETEEHMRKWVARKKSP